MEEDIQLGQRYRDRVTGLTGIVTGRCEYLNGCIQWLVKPPLDKDGKSRDGEWIDEGQLAYVDDGLSQGPTTPPPPSSKPGGPSSDVPSESYGG
jgi:hypothetical protein